MNNVHILLVKNDTYMRTIHILFTILLIAPLFQGCDDNEIMPGYQKKGTATSTVATVAASNTKPAQSTDITISLGYVNPTSDRLKTVELRAKVGSSAYTTVQTFDASADAPDAQITREVIYKTPATAGTVTFDMVITSQMPYPQIVRTTVAVQ